MHTQKSQSNSINFQTVLQSGGYCEHIHPKGQTACGRMRTASAEGQITVEIFPYFFWYT